MWQVQVRSLYFNGSYTTSTTKILWMSGKDLAGMLKTPVDPNLWAGKEKTLQAGYTWIPPGLSIEKVFRIGIWFQIY